MNTDRTGVTRTSLWFVRGSKSVRFGGRAVTRSKVTRKSGSCPRYK